MLTEELSKSETLAPHPFILMSLHFCRSPLPKHKVNLLDCLDELIAGLYPDLALRPRNDR